MDSQHISAAPGLNAWPVVCPARIRGRSLAITIVMLFVIALPALARNLADYGQPFITVFTPDEYHNDGQCLDLELTDDGRVYVANANGLLEYDGAQWRTVEGTDGRAFLCVEVDRRGRVWAGGDTSIGVLVEDDQGILVFHALSPEFPPDTKPQQRALWYWRVREGEDGIYIQSPRAMMRYQPNDDDPREGEWTVWMNEPGVNLNMVMPFENRVWVKQHQQPLAWLQGDTLQPVPGADDFPPIGVFHVVRFDEENLLLTAFRAGVHLYNPETGVTRPFSSPFFDLIDRTITYGSVPHGEDRFVATSKAHGVLVWDRNGVVRERIDEIEELPTVVASRSGDMDGNGGFWVPLDYGLARLELDSPQRITTASQGLNGVVTAMAVHEGTLFVGTSADLFRYVPPTEAGRTGRFEAVEGVGRATWYLRSRHGALLGATVAGLVHLQPDGSARTLDGTDGNLFMISWHPNGRDLFTHAELKGVFHYRLRADGTFRFIGRISRRQDDLRDLHWLDDTRFLGLSRMGEGVRICRGEFDVESDTVLQYEDITDSLGLNGTLSRQMLIWRDRVWVSSEDGLFGYDPETGRFNSDESLLGVDAGTDIYLEAHAVDSDGRLWVASGPGRITRIDPDAPPGRNVVTAVARDGIRRFLCATADRERGFVHFGTDDGRVLTIDTRRPDLDLDPPRTVLRRAVAGGDSMIAGSHLPGPGRSLRLDFERRDIRFYWTSPAGHGATQSQYRVVGYEQAWSEWTDETYRDYSGLPAGSYQFEVRSRDEYDQVGEPARVAFVIRPPWYRSAWAWVLWLVLGASSVSVLIGARVRHERIRKRRLEELVQIRTAELEASRVQERETELKARQAETATTMAATLAHEFNNPLAIIKTACQIAETEGDASHARAMLLTKIPPQVDRMSDLIKSILEIRELREIDYAAGMKIVDLHARGGQRNDEESSSSSDPSSSPGQADAGPGSTSPRGNS